MNGKTRDPVTRRDFLATVGVAALGFGAGTMGSSDSESHASQPDSIFGSAAFDRKMTVEAMREPLGDLLTQLGSGTGFSFRAEGFIADERVTVFAIQVSLRSILLGLRDLLSYSWSADEGIS